MRSLTLRLVVFGGLWVAAGLGLAGWVLVDVVTRQIEAGLDARLASLLDGVAAAAGIDAGRLGLARDPAGADFDRPFSGAYWQMTGPDGAVATSRSLWDEALPVGDPGARDAAGPRGAMLRVLTRDVTLPDLPGPVRIAVALSRAETEAETARLRFWLVAVFTVLGAGLVGGVAAGVVIGLAPLRRATRALAEVRDGRRQALDLAAPPEIAPLIAGIDALIAQNRATVARARTHVGNLAHALKTPLAVLRNGLDATPPDTPLLRAQTATLDRLVQHHLARARVAAVAGGLAAEECAPLALAEEIAAALRRLMAGRGIAFAVSGAAGLRVRAGRQDMTEMLGNLMENAGKFAAARVEVTVAAAAPGLVAIDVCDDGPGLDDAEAVQALARGGRLDESQPGSGLGLAIVADLIAALDGTLTLTRSPEGGLCARMVLPGG